MNLYYYKFITVSVLAGLLVCSGCSNPKKTLGLNRTAPDEFTVVARAPLTLPPDYNLTPPAEAVAAERKTAAEKAKDTLFATSLTREAIPVDVKDKGANIILSKAGASATDAGIRDTIAKEGALLIEQDKDFTDRLVFWRDPGDDPTAVAVDAEKETMRLQSNQALGKPVTEGETPTIARKKKALLEFN